MPVFCTVKKHPYHGDASPVQTQWKNVY